MENRPRDGTWPAVLLLAAVLVAAGCPSSAHAQSVQKCIGPEGHVTLTSGECSDGQLLAGTYEAVPEPFTAATAGRPESQRRQTGASSRSGAIARTAAARARPDRTKARGKSSSNRCQAARDRREQTLQRVGLKRTFDLLRKLDDEVWAACARAGG